MLLVLFDIDGTLFLTPDELANEASLAAVEEVFGVVLPTDCVSKIDHPGRTALSIIKEVLRRAGLEDATIEAGLGRWCERNSSRYVALLADADTSFWETVPGAAETLAELEGAVRMVLLTGNPEPMAWARLERLGLARFLERGQGAFGCEAEEREELIALARLRAGTGELWPAEATILVGDTPRDVEGAHAAGIRVVALTSERFDRAALAVADAVITRLPALPGALAELAGSP